MILKSIPAGDLFAYVEGPKGKFGKSRVHKPLRGLSPLATALLRAQAPPCVLKLDRKRRYVRHCRGHLTHLYTGFSEPLDKVEQTLPIVIKTIESLVLAGLPRDCLAFVWYEHPQSVGAHTHAGLVHSLLPRGGPYTPALTSDLLFPLSRLLSYQLKLSDPLEPERARLIRPGPASAADPENRSLIERVIDAVENCPAQDIPDHKVFLRFLDEKLHLKVAAVPAPGRTPVPLDPSRPNGFKSYPAMVGVWHPGSSETRVIYFGGAVCRRAFKRVAWEAEKEDRARKCRWRPQDVARRYNALKEELTLRIRDQQKRYPFAGGEDRVSLAEFDWLGRPRKSEDTLELIAAIKAQPSNQAGAASNATFGDLLPRLSMPEHVYTVREKETEPHNPFVYQPAITYPFLELDSPAQHRRGSPSEDAMEGGLDEAPMPWDTEPHYFLPLPPGTWESRVTPEPPEKLADDRSRSGPEVPPSLPGPEETEEQCPKPLEQVRVVAGEEISTPDHYEAQQEERRRKLKRLRTKRVLAIGVANSERLRNGRIRTEPKQPPIDPPPPPPSGLDL